jgi:WhiB family redox-sensing transcriptional regulator
LQPRVYWKTRGNCRNVEDPDVFFGEDNKLPMPKDEVDAARAWCRRCPVARDCLIFAFQQNEHFGIWGGFTYEERKRARELTGSLVEAVALFDLNQLHDLVVRL